MNETAKPHLKVSKDIPAPSLEQLEEELKIAVDTNQASHLEREDYEKIAADIADCEETIAMYDRGLAGEKEIIDG